MTGFEFVVVVLDPGAKLHLFDLNVVLLLFRLPSRPLCLILVFTVVHEFDHRRPSLGSHFHEIEPLVMGEFAGLFDRNDSDLPTLASIRRTGLIRICSFIRILSWLIFLSSYESNPVLPSDLWHLIHKKTRIIPGHEVTEAAADPTGLPCPGPGGFRHRMWNRKVEPRLRRLASVLSGAPYTGV